MDNTIEGTENKGLEGAGGIIGLSLHGPALVRWLLCRPVIAQYVQQVQNYMGEKQDGEVSFYIAAKSAAAKR